MSFTSDRFLLDKLNSQSPTKRRDCPNFCSIMACTVHCILPSEEMTAAFHNLTFLSVMLLRESLGADVFGKFEKLIDEGQHAVAQSNSCCFNKPRDV